MICMLGSDIYGTITSVSKKTESVTYNHVSRVHAYCLQDKS